MATCIIRDRRDDDLPALANALVRVHARDGYPVEGVADPLAWLQHPHAFRSWTALVDNVPVGQVTLVAGTPGDDAAEKWVNSTNGSLGDLAIIVRLFVDPDQRAVGAGHALVEAALSHARQIGRFAALDVMAKDHAAIRLYERIGGRRLGEVTHSHGSGLTEPALVFDFPDAPRPNT